MRHDPIPPAYEIKCDGCDTIFDAFDAGAMVYEALDQGWGFLFDQAFCPECLTDNYNPDTIVGKHNENRGETDTEKKR